LQADHKESEVRSPKIEESPNWRYQPDLEFRISSFTSGFAFGFAKPGDAVAFFPLTAFLEKFEALKTLQNIAFSAQSGGCAQAAML
jgi:hypothetical protein